VKHPPDKSVGGTFHYDAQGHFVRHDPPTAPAAAALPEPEAPASPASPDAAPRPPFHPFHRGARRTKE